MSCLNQVDRSQVAEEMNRRFANEHQSSSRKRVVTYYPMYDVHNFLRDDLSVVLLAVPLIDFADTVTDLPYEKLSGKLVVEVCRLSAHPKEILLQHLPPDVDVLCTHPMFGSPRQDNNDQDVYDHDQDDRGMLWDDLPFVYEPVHIHHEE